MRRAALAEDGERNARYLHADARTADGVPIDVMINVARPEEVDDVDVATCDGVGLMRTEFLFTGDTLPDEETQYRAYAKVLDWAAGRPVTIRTIDAGGDKPVKGLTVEEQNPFLGLRGIRLSLARPEVFRVQLRALARAATRGNLKVMLPMVTMPVRDRRRAPRHLDEVLAELAGGGDRGRAPAARHHGRGAGRRHHAEGLFRRRVLLHRLERPHPIRHRRGARQPSRRRPLRRHQPGGDEAHRRRRRVRRAERHRGEPLRRRGRPSGARAAAAPGRAAQPLRRARRCSAR